MTCKERKRCGTIIHMAAGAAALVGSGMAQIPLADAVLIIPIQIKMIIALGSVFEVKLTESAAKGLFASLSASCIGRATSQLLVGQIPILGNILNAGTAAGLTEAVGWLAVEHFQMERAKRSFGEAVRNCFVPDYKSKNKWRRFWRKAKIFCEECFENLMK